VIMRNDDRFIPGEEIKDVAQWKFAAIETAAQLLQAQMREREAQQQQAQHDVQCQQSYQDGFAAGVEHGRQMAQQALQEQAQALLEQQTQEAAQRFAGLFQQAERQLHELEQTLAQGTLELACELARQVLRRELTVDTQAVLPVLREALGLLEQQHKAAQVRLHPNDLEALGELIRADLGAGALHLRADETLRPGDCLVESDGMVVDGTVAKRWQRAVAALGLASRWEQSDERV